LSERPYRICTWAPLGHTPVLQFTLNNWQRMSAIAGLTARTFCFRLHRSAIRGEQVVAFLRQLRRFLGRRKLLVIWDRAPIHRKSAKVRNYIESLGGRIEVAYLPAYAPELNPIEYLWGYWKRTELANFCPKDIWELGHFASQALKRVRRQPRRIELISAFYKQAELF
jgi:transposase